MSYRQKLGPCRSKRGLLFLRDCRQPASEMCARCGRPVCPEHAIQERDEILCAECAAGRESIPDTSSSARRAFRRHHYYNSWGYHPYYYGHHHYYSDNDYNTFDDQELVDHDMSEGAEAAGAYSADHDDDGDFMES